MRSPSPSAVRAVRRRQSRPSSPQIPADSRCGRESGTQARQSQQLRRPAQVAPAPHGQPIPAAFAATGDVDPCPLWPCHDARTARTADNDAAPRVIVPNHAITGSYSPAPLQPPPTPGPDHEPPMEKSRSGNEKVKTLLPEGGERKERPIAKRHRKGLFDVAKRDANCLN